MKKTILFILFLVFSSAICAQDTLSIQDAIDACIALRDAAAAKDSAAIADAARMLKKCDVHEFAYLSSRNREEEISSREIKALDNAFVDSLLNGYISDVRKLGNNPVRGQTKDGSIFSKTYRIKANETKFLMFPSSGYQELSVIALADGMITLKVRARNNAAGFDRTFDDRSDVKGGRRERSMSFTLPDYPNSKVELSVVNCTEKEFDIVVISN